MFDVFRIVIDLSGNVRAQSNSEYILHFLPKSRTCKICSSPLINFKTTTPREIVTTRFGTFWMRETQIYCPEHQYDDDDRPLTYGASFLRSLIRPGFKVGFDVISLIGISRFIQFRQREEIRLELLKQGVSLSAGAISRYADIFIASVECLHHCKNIKLRMLIKESGGYLLHIDSTTETKSDTVFVCLDRVTGTVLLSEKIPTEKEEYIEKQLRKLKKMFGSPVSVMRDMAKPMGNAIQKVFPGVPDKICNFHFLKDIGKDIMGDANVRLGKKMTSLAFNVDLRKLKRALENELTDEEFLIATNILSEHDFNVDALSRYHLKKLSRPISLGIIEWILEYKKQNTGLGFPFDRERLDFFWRIDVIRKRMNRIEGLPKGASLDNELIVLKKILDSSQDQSLRQLIREMKLQATYFDELRKTLRFEITGKTPLSESLSFQSVKEVQEYNKGLVNYARNLKERFEKSEEGLSESEQIIYKHIAKYKLQLPISEELARIFGTDMLESTNNIEESLFRDEKHGLRRTSGKKDISREFRNHGPHLPLMKNLTNEAYIEAIIGAIDDLPEHFSQLNYDEVDYYIEKIAENRRGKFRQSIKELKQMNILSGP